MITFKDRYIAAVERISAELEEAGLNPDRAYNIASNEAYAEALMASQSLADVADRDRKIARGE